MPCSDDLFDRVPKQRFDDVVRLAAEFCQVEHLIRLQRSGPPFSMAFEPGGRIDVEEPAPKWERAKDFELEQPTAFLMAE